MTFNLLESVSILFANDIKTRSNLRKITKQPWKKRTKNSKKNTSVEFFFGVTQDLKSLKWAICKYSPMLPCPKCSTSTAAISRNTWFHSYTHSDKLYLFIFSSNVVSVQDSIKSWKPVILVLWILAQFEYIPIEKP